MLTGFTTPLSPLGKTNLAPMPPWHFVGDFMAIEYWADPSAVAAVLPPGLAPGTDPGKCAIFFSDNQYVSASGIERIDPSVNQYMECFIAVSATWEGKDAAACPYIFVDNDNSMVRGLIQGMPKQIGTVRMSRSFSLESKAAPHEGSGGLFAATLAHRDRRLVEATVTLENQVDDAPNRMLARMINMRYFPNLAAGLHQQPAVHELVRQKARDVARSPVWRGQATLTINDSPWHEMGALKPVKVGHGFRYTFAMTVDDLTTVRDLRTAMQK
ncbi:acetoacetate decarboxylase family protein [Hydrogenophaga sp. BPS33]|uniref:acetoacetate decarboxylase family protein n=1 Tax=Hydrogenophaga sp. BPS33 TaxID=2651974 RepID=UPI00131F4DF6|nr:acetoacetate decarboxylase family protein [Hydrogenophaga sp. BPS33]QHE84509.1 acetoacetate decarboxylase [Hydrogenophaga sp. BPS33]